METPRRKESPAPSRRSPITPGIAGIATVFTIIVIYALLTRPGAPKLAGGAGTIVSVPTTAYSTTVQKSSTTRLTTTLTAPSTTTIFTGPLNSPNLTSCGDFNLTSGMPNTTVKGICSWVKGPLIISVYSGNLNATGAFVGATQKVIVNGSICPKLTQNETYFYPSNYTAYLYTHAVNPSNCGAAYIRIRTPQP